VEGKQNVGYGKKTIKGNSRRETGRRECERGRRVKLRGSKEWTEAEHPQELRKLRSDANLQFLSISLFFSYSYSIPVQLFCFFFNLFGLASVVVVNVVAVVILLFATVYGCSGNYYICREYIELCFPP